MISRMHGRRPQLCLALGILATIICAIGIFVTATAAAIAWLAAALFWMGLPVGALALLMIHDIAGGRWGDFLRPSLMALIALLPLVTVLFLPILALLPFVYPWARLDEAADLANRFYLNAPFFIGRAVLYLIAWNGLALLRLRRADPAVPQRRLSAAGLVILALTTSFAAIDWAMSLEPHWSSSVYGLLVSTGWFVTGLAGTVLLALRRDPVSSENLRADLKADLGKLLLAAIAFAAYLAFMQFLIIWEENLAKEIPWYLWRLADGWGGLALLIILVEYLIPFVALLPRGPKRRADTLACLCGLVLVGRLLETWWFVLPARTGSSFGAFDIAAMIGVGGILLGFLSARIGAQAQGHRLQARIFHA